MPEHLGTLTRTSSSRLCWSCCVTVHIVAHRLLPGTLRSRPSPHPTELTCLARCRKPGHRHGGCHCDCDCAGRGAPRAAVRVRAPVSFSLLWVLAAFSSLSCEGFSTAVAVYGAISSLVPSSGLEPIARCVMLHRPVSPMPATCLARTVFQACIALCLCG